jgi:hypothetical protein
MALPVSHYLQVYRLRQAMGRDGAARRNASAQAFIDQLVESLARLDPSLPCDLVHVPAQEGGEWIAFVVQGQEQARAWVGTDRDEANSA